MKLVCQEFYFDLSLLKISSITNYKKHLICTPFPSPEQRNKFWITHTDKGRTKSQYSRASKGMGYSISWKGHAIAVKTLLSNSKNQCLQVTWVKQQPCYSLNPLWKHHIIANFLWININYLFCKSIVSLRIQHNTYSKPLIDYIT